MTIYCTLTVGGDGLITANLLGPLVINPRTRRGRQLVLTESGYSTRHPVAQLQGA
jgi:flagellar assembly factor FliW